MKKYFTNQFTNILTTSLPSTLCEFRKGHVTQHCLLFMLENLNKALDRGFYIGVLLTDLSKAFYILSHDLLIAKFNAYGFSE